VGILGAVVQRRFLIPAFRDDAFEHLSFVVNSAPEIVVHAVDLHENLVEMPASMPEMPHRLDPTSPDLGRENRAEPVPPEPDRLIRDIYAPLMKQVFNIPKR
jgi:hypothetical protein